MRFKSLNIVSSLIFHLHTYNLRMKKIQDKFYFRIYIFSDNGRTDKLVDV